MYRIRFIWVMLKSLLSGNKELLDDFKLQFWVVPLLDTDVKFLFTQTYNQYMGLARWNYMFNSKFKGVALKKGWLPMTVAETIRYKKSIKAFDTINLVTRLIHWNEHRFYLEHVFYVKGTVYAHCYIEGLVRSPKGALKPNEAFKELGVTMESPPMPDEIRGWVESLEYQRKK